MPEGGLGDFLRSRRERIAPETVGLPARRRRRTPGLRREDVAELAGIGVDWYVRLEQGRAGSPSAATVDALARALRLDPAERDHLAALAHRPRPRSRSRERLPAATRALVHALDRPAYVTGRRWDLLAWNAAAHDLFPGLDRLPDGDRNVLVYLLLTPEAREVFGTSWPRQARRTTAQFRAAHDRCAPDDAFTRLASRLRHASPEFGPWWDRHDVEPPGAGHKTLRGRPYTYATFQANENPTLRLTIYTPG